MSVTVVSTGHFERCPYGSGLGCTDRHARKVWVAVSARDVLEALRPMYRDPGPVLGEMVRHGRIAHTPDATYRYVPPAPPPVSGGIDDDWPRDATPAEKRAEAAEAYRMVAEGPR